MTINWISDNEAHCPGCDSTYNPHEESHVGHVTKKKCCVIGCPETIDVKISVLGSMIECAPSCSEHVFDCLITEKAPDATCFVVEILNPVKGLNA